MDLHIPLLPDPGKNAFKRIPETLIQRLFLSHIFTFFSPFKKRFPALRKYDSKTQTKLFHLFSYGYFIQIITHFSVNNDVFYNFFCFLFEVS